MNAVEVHNLRKEFVRKDGRKRTRVAALRGVTFEIARGECIAILGQNGSGKSTLVRLLSTLLLPDGGSARIFGHDVSESRAVRTLVNRVSVEASFFKKMSATENLAYAARFYGLTPKETKRADPGDPRRGSASPCLAADALDGEPLARDAAEGRARAGAPHLAGAAPARRADHGPRPAVEARGAGLHPRGAGDPRHDDPALHARPRRGRDPRRADRDPRRRRAALPRDRPTRSRSATASRRSRRRSSPRPARRSRTSARKRKRR